MQPYISKLKISEGIEVITIDDLINLRFIDLTKSINLTKIIVENLSYIDKNSKIDLSYIYTLQTIIINRYGVHIDYDIKPHFVLPYNCSLVLNNLTSNKLM